MWSTTILLAVLAGCILLIVFFDWNHVKPWLNAKVSEATDRPFAINGNLSVKWHLPRTQESGWRRWVPWPYLNATDVTLGNLEWATTGRNMAEVKSVTFSLSPLPLLHKEIVLPTLVLEEPKLALERARDGKNNWTFKSNGPSKWQLEQQELTLDKGTVRIVDAIKHADIKANIDTLDKPSAENYGIGWKVGGTFNGAVVSGGGQAGGILSLKNESAPYPLQADLHVGKTSIAVKGTLTKPRDLAAIDMRLKLSGLSMAHLYPLTGIVLPETPPFSTEGHLTGAPDKRGGNWTYDKFSGKVGSSDLGGTLEYRTDHERPLLEGTLVSALLNLEDLAPLIGADSNASKTQRGAAPVQPPDKVLPVETFKTDRWTSINANVKFTGRKIVRDKSLPIDNLTTNLHLNDGVLSLTPLNFGVAGGNLISNIKLDGRADSIKAEAKVSARHLQLKQLFPAVQSMQASFGEVNGDASLSALGNSIASMLGSSNGEIKASITQGTISKLLLEEVGLNVGSIVLTKLFGDKQVQLNCMASDFAVTNGLMQTRTFLMDTQEATVYISGDIDLAREQFGLTINPRSKRFKLVSLRAPLYVNGTFKKPDVNIDKGVLALKAGGAIALGAVAPIAALVPLANPGSNKDDNQCAAAVSEAQVKPKAPPPGKRRLEQHAAK